MDSREEFEDLVCKVTNARNFTIREEDGEYASERVQDMFLIWEAACAQSVQSAKPVAWMNPSNPHEVISYKKKNEINRCYNLGIGKSAERYSVPLYTQPEGDWVKCSDKLPENSSPVQAITDDYPSLGLTVVPARYTDGIGWTDIDNTDRDGDEHPLCEVVAWKELAQLPAGLNRPQTPVKQNKSCAFIPLPSGDAIGGILCTECGETFEKEINCPVKQEGKSDE